MGGRCFRLQYLCGVYVQLYSSANKAGKRSEFVELMNRQGIVKNFEAQVRRRDGEIIWISENAREVKDGNGRLMFYEGTVSDITQRKKHEQELKYLSTH